jgi:hypothetical protein
MLLEFAGTVAGVVQELVVAPATLVPYQFHWYVKMPDPDALTLNVAGVPASTVALLGCVVMEGELVFGAGTLPANGCGSTNGV